jgi:chorismate mutase/prephenate dehydratase
MNPREELAGLRVEIDALDRELVRLFGERMGVSARIAEAKARGNIALVDNAREKEVMEAAVAQAGEGARAETAAFMRTLLALSRQLQSEMMLPAAALALPEPAPAPAKAGERPRVAYQGVPGAWGEHAALQLYPGAALLAQDDFEGVFEAVKSGAADYGALPIENSRTGAIGDVYDLLRGHGCYIVAQIWVKVAQCLLAVPGARLAGVREVLSHTEGLAQCARFLKQRNWELVACRNTAVAAKAVAERGDAKAAAIGSRRAAEAYGLEVLAADIMDRGDNKTRFIAIAAAPEYDEGCDTTSVTFSTAHRSGALLSVLECFALAGLNLTRIESRPVTAGKYRFFADVDANLASDVARQALRQAAAASEYFEVLGCLRTVQERAPRP